MKPSSPKINQDLTFVDMQISPQLEDLTVDEESENDKVNFNPQSSSSKYYDPLSV